MLSIGKLAAGQADYYVEQAQTRLDRAGSVGSGVEDYYVAPNEAPGQWVGVGSDRLGLRGQVERTELVRVLEGTSPATGAPLVNGHARRVPGFDVTFSAPKSVNVLFGIGDEPLRRAIRSAHDEAVAEALAYLERVAVAAMGGRRWRGVGWSRPRSGIEHRVPAIRNCIHTSWSRTSSKTHTGAGQRSMRAGSTRRARPPGASMRRGCVRV